MRYSYTIVIPVYNAEKYISQMIDSVIAQTYENWNMIIIDDGSTDGTPSICDNYVDDRIKVFHYENQGQMVARITGIMKASGDYTLVVDADDYLQSECLEKVNNILSTIKYDMVLFPFMNCDENLKPTGEISGRPNRVGELCQNEVLNWVISTYNHGLVDKVVKTELIQKGAQEATTRRLTINGDYALVVPIICHISRAFYLDDVLYLYRIYGLSISHNPTFQHILDTNYVSLEMLRLLKMHGLGYGEIVKSVYQANLHMIIWMMEGLVLGGKFRDEYLNELIQLQGFKESLKYGEKKKFSFAERVELFFLKHQSHNYKWVIRCVNIWRQIKSCMKQTRYSNI